MMIIDLTHIMKEGMPIFPGTQKPEFVDINTLEKDGFAQKLIKLCSHVGTHIDAPSHVYEGKNSLDEFSVDKFMGKGIVINVKGMESIELETVRKYEEKINDAEFILFRSGWDEYWGEEKYFGDFPALSEEAAKWIGDQDLKGVGVDAISMDRMLDEELPIHKILLEKGFIFIENLKGLGELLDREFIFSCLPLKIEGADGSPVRAVAIISE